MLSAESLQGRQLLGRRQGVTARSLYTVGDQALSSASNFLLSVYVARAVSPTAFGSFVAVLSVVYGLQAIQRAGLGESLLATTAGPQSGGGREARGAVVVAFSFGLVCSCLLALILRAPVDIFVFPLNLHLVLAPLFAIDVCRYIFLAEGRPSKAFALDLLWVVAQVVSFGLIWGSPLEGEAAGGIAVLAWAGSGVLGALFTWRHGLRVSRQEFAAWIGRTRRHVGALGAQAAIAQISAQGIIVGVGLILPAAALGQLRVAQLVTMPAGIFLAASMPLLMPHMAQLYLQAGDRGVLTKMVARYSAYLLFPAVTLVGLALLGGGWAVIALFGPAYTDAAWIVIPAALTVGLQFLVAPLGAALRIIDGGRGVLHVQLFYLPLSWGIVLGLSWRFELLGMAWAGVLAIVVMGILNIGYYWKGGRSDALVRADSHA